jgi:hypothetical protein
MGGGSLRLGGPATGGLIRPVHVHPLATKCRVEPTGFCWGKSNSRITASSNGWVELEVTLSGGVGESGMLKCRFTRHMQYMIEIRKSSGPLLDD